MEKERGNYSKEQQPKSMRCHEKVCNLKRQFVCSSLLCSALTPRKQSKSNPYIFIYSGIKNEKTKTNFFSVYLIRRWRKLILIELIL